MKKFTTKLRINKAYKRKIRRSMRLNKMLLKKDKY